jgi:Coenzyme PQQ synthesis protein D (PqqD)
MNKFIENYAPRARQEDLVIEGLGDETLVYDMRNHKAHCLNRTAALVWNRCDGKATVSDISDALEKELRTLVSWDFIWLTLEQLDKAKLLSDRLPGSISQQAMTRRAVIRKIGLGAAIALPLVTSILTPTAEASTTCIAGQQACSPTIPCCVPPCNGTPGMGGVCP